MKLSRTRGGIVFKVETGANSSAVPFYEKHGFVLEGRLSSHYGEHMDAIVLSRSLTDSEILTIADQYVLASERELI